MPCRSNTTQTWGKIQLLSHGFPPTFSMFWGNSTRTGENRLCITLIEALVKGMHIGDSLLCSDDGLWRENLSTAEREDKFSSNIRAAEWGFSLRVAHANNWKLLMKESADSFFLLRKKPCCLPHISTILVLKAADVAYSYPGWALEIASDSEPDPTQNRCLSDRSTRPTSEA